MPVAATKHPDSAWRLPLCAALLALASACGGTSSDTPWPVEPEGVDLAPAGEARDREVPPPPPPSEEKPSDDKPSNESESSSF